MRLVWNAFTMSIGQSLTAVLGGVGVDPCGEMICHNPAVDTDTWLLDCGLARVAAYALLL